MEKPRWILAFMLQMCTFSVIGATNCTFADIPNEVITSCNTIASEESCSLSCKEGYSFSNTSSRSLTCNSNGTWSTDLRGVCRTVICYESPEYIINGTIEEGCPDTFGERCPIRCDETYVLSGTGIAVCDDANPSSDENENGVWNIGDTACSESENMSPRNQDQFSTVPFQDSISSKTFWITTGILATALLVLATAWITTCIVSCQKDTDTHENHVYDNPPVSHNGLAGGINSPYDAADPIHPGVEDGWHGQRPLNWNNVRSNQQQYDETNLQATPNQPFSVPLYENHDNDNSQPPLYENHTINGTNNNSDAEYTDPADIAPVNGDRHRNPMPLPRKANHNS